MQKEHEEQLKLKQEIEVQMQEELRIKQSIKEQIEKQMLSTHARSSEIDYDPIYNDYIMNHPSFRRDESSILSYNKSISEECSSFINDIRTVYELQDEDGKYTRFNAI
jgi:hypothetical protein